MLYALVVTGHVYGVQVKGLDGKWQQVSIPSSVKAIVLLNLQSYGGGRDIWGLADNNKDTQRGWKTPIFNDGMFEVRYFAGLRCVDMHRYVKQQTFGFLQAFNVSICIGMSNSKPS